MQNAVPDPPAAEAKGACFHAPFFASVRICLYSFRPLFSRNPIGFSAVPAPKVPYPSVAGTRFAKAFPGLRHKVFVVFRPVLIRFFFASDCSKSCKCPDCPCPLPVFGTQKKKPVRLPVRQYRSSEIRSSNGTLGSSGSAFFSCSEYAVSSSIVFISPLNFRVHHTPQSVLCQCASGTVNEKLKPRFPPVVLPESEGFFLKKYVRLPEKYTF